MFFFFVYGIRRYEPFAASSSRTTCANASTALWEVNIMPPNSQSGLVPMRFWRSRVRSLSIPASSNWCCKTGTNVGSKDRLLLLSPLLDAFEKSSSYASVGLDFVLSSRTGIGCSGSDDGGGDMIVER